MISKKTKYALNSLIYLAKNYGRGPVFIHDLARKEGMPKKFLEAILLELKNKGFLQSRRGKAGGYLLGKSPEKIILGEVIRVLEGPLAPVSCVSQTAYQKCDECKDENCCGIRFLMKDVRDAIANILDNTNLSDVLKRIESIKENNNVTYEI